LADLTLRQFDFSLPDSLIAQTPQKERDGSRLLHFNRLDNGLKDHSFKNIIDLIPNNSVIVLNNTKVINARVLAYRTTGAKVECFFLEKLNTNQWRVLLKNSRRVQENDTLIVDDHHQITILQKSDKYAHVQIEGPLSDMAFLDAFGAPPLPPYIKASRPHDHADRYQTVFAKEPGAVAAPTASLHFTDALFSQLTQKGIDIIYITLHIGLGTFNPINTDRIVDHKMHHESYHINFESATRLTQAKRSGKPIFAIGTTVARCLESNIHNNVFVEERASTDLFIYPGYTFKAIDALLTNFHLPKSSLLILVSAFMGHQNAQRTYQHAIEHRYRFFSYGDAMLIT
jgi:S-adenosylmethionine:tRNA ribosyltransferase-isomerase